MTKFSFDDFPPIESLREDKGASLAFEDAQKVTRGYMLFLRKSCLNRAIEVVKITPVEKTTAPEYAYYVSMVLNWSGVKYPPAASGPESEREYVATHDFRKKPLEEEVEESLMRLARRLIQMQAALLNQTKCKWEELLGPIPSLA